MSATTWLIDQEFLTRTRTKIVIVGVNTVDPQPSGISLRSFTTFALLPPLVRATIVEAWDSNRAASLSDCTRMKTNVIVRHRDL